MDLIGKTHTHTHTQKNAFFLRLSWSCDRRRLDRAECTVVECLNSCQHDKPEEKRSDRVFTFGAPIVAKHLYNDDVLKETVSSFLQLRTLNITVVDYWIIS